MPSSPRAVSTISRGDRVALGLGAQRLAGPQAVLEGGRAPHDRVGDQLRQPVPDAVLVAEHPRGVARRGSREHPAERDDLRDRLGAVLLGHVADHALAAADGEVDVDVRHRDALRVEEALEEQVVAERVDVGDPEAVGDDRARGGAAARPDGDAVRLRVGDEVPDDEEVAAEAHRLDDPQLHLHPLDRLGRRRVAVAPHEPRLDLLAQVCRLGAALRRRVARDELVVELELDVAAVGDLERRGDRLRPLREGARHLLVGAQVELVRLEGELRLRERRLRLHAEQRRVVVVVLAAQVVDVARPHERPADLPGDADDPLVGPLLVREAVLLHLEVDVVGPEGAEQVVGVGARVGRAILEQPPAEAGGEAAGEGDHAFAVRGEQAEVDRRLAPVQPVEEAGGGQLDEVAVPGRRWRRAASGGGARPCPTGGRDGRRRRRPRSPRIGLTPCFRQAL